MIKYYLVLPLIVFFAFKFHAQIPKHDENWVMGSSGIINGDYCGYILHGWEGKEEPKVTLIPNHIAGTRLSLSSVSDSAGNLRFYTDGCKVFNSAHEVVENGDSINAHGRFVEMCANIGVGYDMWNGLIMLPWPDATNRYVLFHTRYDSFPENAIKHHYPTDLYMTEIDGAANTGKGKVIVKNVSLIRGHLSDMMTAVRHGNGRDWWISIPPTNTDSMLLLLLTPEGVLGPYKKKVPFNWLSNGAGWTAGTAMFSPNGTKYARTTARFNGVHVYDFDRCTGTFGEGIKLEIPQDLVYSALTFSPNGRFLYVSNTNELFQFDLESVNVQNSRVKIGHYDGFVSPRWPTNFSQMSLAPNGKIYMVSTNTNRSIHIIQAPNERGHAADFRQHHFVLPCVIDSNLPIFPYFKLFDRSGSICDTLGIDAPVIHPCSLPLSKGIVSPNPANFETSIVIPRCTENDPIDLGIWKIKIYTIDGKLLFDRENLLSSMKVFIDTQSWPNGVYAVHLLLNGKRMFSNRLIILH